MKKISLISLIICITTMLYAQEKVKTFPFKNSISLSPFANANKTIFINYERIIKNKVGLFLSAGAHYSNQNYTIYGYLGELQFRYYIQNKAFKENVWNRFFISPYFLYGQYQISDYKYVQEKGFVKVSSLLDFSLYSYGGGIVIGYNLTIKKFLLEAFCGEGLRFSKNNIGSEIQTDLQGGLRTLDYNGIEPKLGFSIGFNF